MNQSIFICVLGVWNPVLFFPSSLSLPDEDWQTFLSVQILGSVCLLLNVDFTMWHMQNTQLLICIVGQKGQCCILYWLNTFPVYALIWENCYTVHVWDLVKVWERGGISLFILSPLILAKPLCLLKDYGFDSWPMSLNLSLQCRHTGFLYCLNWP